MNPYKFHRRHYSTHQVMVRILKQIISPTSAVLDLGCNTGYLGEQVGEGLWTGVERDPNTRPVLEKIPVYNRVITGDLEHFNFSQFAKESFDVVLMADILEHLINPEHVLREILSVIKPGGKVVISLPNVANWQIRLSLMFGFFTYKDVGILDRTHVHLYEKHSARRLVESNGLRIRRMIFTSTFFGIVIRFLPCLGPLLGHGIVIVAQPSKR